jgi:hypothetical protein
VKECSYNDPSKSEKLWEKDKQVRETIKSKMAQLKSGKRLRETMKSKMT